MSTLVAPKFPKASASRAATLDLISRAPLATNRCIAKTVGISGERVRQIRQEHGLRAKRYPNTLISWPCPSCGAEVKMWTGARNGRKTVYCAVCAKREAGKARRVEIPPLICPDCGQGRIRKGRANALHAKKDYPNGLRCLQCYWKARRKEKTHCVYGHALTPDNMNIYMKPDGYVTRRCRTCDARRSRETYQRKARRQQ